jgi:hypothetical protein
MISWETIIYGAGLSAVAAAVLVAATRRGRRLSVLVIASVSAGGGALAWNAILHRVHGSEFFVDAPLSVLPASWQDTGSGVFSTALATALLGFGPLRRETAFRAAGAALICGLAAFLVDVYLY